MTGDKELMETAYSLAQKALALPADIPFYSAMARGAMALRAVQQEDPAAAAEQYDALKGLPAVLLLYVSSERVLGLLARTLGNLELAVKHFEDALAFCRQAGYQPELAWTSHDYAEMLLRRNGPGDYATAVSLLEESRRISTELGMQPLLDRGRTAQEQLVPQRVTGTDYPDGLTEREVQVLNLIANGRSNSEIADQLVLSVRTVERHITNLYTKINARGRADATAYALSRNLANYQ